MDDLSRIPTRTQPVSIRTARLLLRPFTADDLDGLHAAVWGDPLVTKYLPGGQPRPLDGTQRIVNHFLTCWERETETAWAVVLPEGQSDVVRQYEAVLGGLGDRLPGE